MRYLAATVFSALLLVACLPGTAEASPWTQSGGEYYVKLGNTFYHASAYRDSEGTLIDDASYLSSTTSTYAEIGILPETHLQLYLPLMYARAYTEFESQDDLGFGDSTLSVQTSPLDLGVPTSARLEAKLPLYGRNNPLAPTPGDRQVDLGLWLSIGGGLHSLDLPVYFYLDAGYRHRTEWTFDDAPAPEYSDVLVSMAEIGYTIADSVTVALNSSAFLPLDPNPFLDETYVTAGPKLFWPVTDSIALEVDGYATPYSRNSGAGWALSAGVSFFNEDG